MRYRRCAGAAALLLILFALIPRALSAQEQGVFELRLTALAETRTVLVLVEPSGEVLVPLRPTLEFLRIPVREAGDTLVLDWPPEIWRTSMVRSERRARVGADTLVFTGAEWRESEGEIYLAAAALSRLLQGQVTVDWENLGIVITGQPDYPILVHARNQARREAAGPRRLDEIEALEASVPYPKRSGGAALAWDVSIAAEPGATDVNARLASGFAVLGGSLESGVSAGSEAGDLALSAPFVRYVRGFPRSSWVRRVQVGHVYTEGLTARSIFGGTITNEPLYTPTIFGEALLRPLVPAGWEYEVYQGEQLVGVSTAGSGEAVRTPLSYGATPITVRMIGPAGEERVQEMVFLVPATQVPPGEWRYAAGAGACRTVDCDGYAYGDLRRGLSPRLTVGGGLEGGSHGDSTRVFPYGILAWNPFPAVRTELRVEPGKLLYASIHRYDRLGGWRLTAGQQHEAGFMAPRLARWFLEAGGATRGFLPGRGRTLALGARIEADSGGTIDRWRAGVTTGFGRAQFSTTYESGLQQEKVLSVQGHVLMPRHILRRVQDLNLTGRVDVGEAGLRSVAAGFSARPYDRANVTVLAGWNRESHTPELSIGLLTRLRSAYVQTNAYAQGARRGAFVSGGGGVAIGGDRLLADPFPMIGRAGITGRAFLDENGNGIYDSGEATIRGAPIAVGADRAFTDSAGRYTAWGLFPYAVLEAGIDTLNLMETDLAASGGTRRVRLTPNMFSSVDLPLVRTREVTGRIAWSEGVGPVAGVTVELVRDGESEARRVVTFSDGAYYIPQLPPGKYTIGIAASSLSALRAVLDPGPVEFILPAVGPAAVEAPTLHLRRP